MSQSNTKALSSPFHITKFLSWLRDESPPNFFIKDPRARIFLVSFSMLFFELLCIRWVPSYVRYLSYFNNFILLASFLGIGLGMLTARRRRFWYPPFPLLVLLMVIIVSLNKFELHITTTDVIYYVPGADQTGSTENFFVLPLIFGMITLCFIPLGRSLGQLFSQVKPLSAYTFDIIGSLVGIASFSIIAFLSLPPLVWFALLSIPIMLLSSKKTIAFIAITFFVTVVITWQMGRGAYWSPYYKVVLYPSKPAGYIVDVNNAGGHQAMIPWQRKEPFYKLIYTLFPGNTFQHALILGAGTGSDADIALHEGVKSITAVEIDPTILKLGVRYNPDHPYSNPRVHTVVNDGRAFLENTKEKYDLIIFALPDSLTLTSSNTSLRLESFLLTQDSFKTARSRLTSNGVMVMYNYYREQWLVGKLADMAGHAFNNQQPLVTTYSGWGRAAVIMEGPRLNTIPQGTFGTYHEHAPVGTGKLKVLGQGYYQLTNATPATDDWPFLYLVDRSFPLLYVAGLAVVAIFAVGGVLIFAPRKVLRRFDWHMFFLGVAFMLLEVKSLTTFSLLFGSTWLVNSLVFFAILTSVFLAILVNRHFKLKRIGLFYVLLFGILVVNIVLPPETLLLGNLVARYLLASVLAFAPVFLANIIFTNSFRDSEAADIAFASNLIGIMVGGGLEYLSMLVGYRMLLVLVIVFYTLAFLLRHRKQAGTETADVQPEIAEPTLTT
jgi:Spermine/spermidine synthase domain